MGYRATLGATAGKQHAISIEVPSNRWDVFSYVLLVDDEATIVTITPDKSWGVRARPARSLRAWSDVRGRVHGGRRRGGDRPAVT